MTIRVSDLQSESDLDSLRNSCDVCKFVNIFLSGKRKYKRGLISNPKVDGDKFILDGLVYVARLGSASLKIVQITRRGIRKLLKRLYYTTLCD